LSTAEITPIGTVESTETPAATLVSGNPPGPVLTVVPLPDGEFLAGVGPIGDTETGFNRFSMAVVPRSRRHLAPSHLAIGGHPTLTASHPIRRSTLCCPFQ
jgi:hypothetical protein